MNNVDNDGNVPNNRTYHHVSHKSSRSSANINNELAKINQMPLPSTMDETIRNFNQTRIINESFGELTANLQTEKNNRKSSFKDDFRNSSSSDIVNSLPPLLLPGSNMNNSFNFPTNILSDLSLEPLSNTDEIMMLNSSTRHDSNYQQIRIMFLLSTVICLLIIFFHISAVSMGIVFSNTCEMVDIFLIISGSMHIIIVALEWCKSWIWMPNSNPSLPDTNVDHIQICVSCLLFLLYILSTIWYTVGFAWIPKIMGNPLNKTEKTSHKIYIVHRNVTYTQIIPICSENFYLYVICYQVIVALLFLIRVVMCCMSRFCKLLCRKFTTHTIFDNYDYYASNPLHDILPPLRGPLFSWGFQRDKNATGLNVLYNVNKLSMITPIPIHPSDDSLMQEIVSPPF